ncbi:transmembrane protein 209 [Carex littledalei]|uniref:Transmembrane protein 209 n=1 Tax=Carex littledalei TaxID=544730 RepID=A0A833QY09_9POAL|nr:transmembrane protein 209 [Carex littledalei]
MEGHQSPPAPQGGAKPKFSVRRPTLASGVGPRGPRPYATDLLFLLFAVVASSFYLFYLSSREERLITIISNIILSTRAAEYTFKGMQITTGLFLVVFLTAFFRAFSAYMAPIASPILSSSKPKTTNSESNKKPPKSKSIYEPLVPVRKPLFTQTPPCAEKKATSSPVTPKLNSSPVTSWSKHGSGSGKRIQNEAMLEKFLEEVDEKIEKMWESSASKTATVTPPVSLRGLSSASPGSIPGSTPLSGTTRSTPLRPVRMSPTSASPKKGEGDVPPPMSMEKAVEGYKNLGIYPQIEEWRDCLRQWFSSYLINPLLAKIKTSHVQVMQAATSVGFPITVSQVGIDTAALTAPISLSPANGWQPIVTLDEDELLHKLQTSLIQALNKPPAHQPFGSVQNAPQNPPPMIIQACLDAVTEHQRLKSLMKGELIKGLLPHGSVHADYTIGRVEDLAEGTCLKKYDYMGKGYSSDKAGKKWTGDLPSDSHLLLYLFAAFMEHPGWMLHVDTQWFSGSESSENPLFLGVLPPKERFPEKYVAIILGVPSVIHPGALILSVGKQSTPTFSLYWNKKLQFSLQGRTAFWDAILLFCHKINEDFGSVVRGVQLGSPALNLLSVLDLDTEA